MHPWRRTFWAVWTANLITSIGMMSFLPFFPRHLARLGVSDPDEIALWTGLIFGAAPLVAAFSGPFWGALGDRLGRKWMVLRALLGIAVFVGAMAYARTAQQLFLLRLIQGLFAGFVGPSMTLISAQTPSHQQGRTLGALQTALALGTVAGPLLGAVVESNLGPGAIFQLVAGLSLVSALLILVFAVEPKLERETAAPVPVRVRLESAAPDSWGLRLRRGWMGTLSDLRGHLTHPGLLRLLFVIFCLQFALGATNPLLEMYVTELWDGASEQIPLLTGSLFAAVALTDLIGMPLLGRVSDRHGHRRTLSSCMLLAGLAIFSHALALGYGSLLVMRFVAGAGVAGTRPSSIGCAAEESSREQRGGAISLVVSARMLAVAVGAMCGGLLASWIGLRGLHAFGGLWILIGWFAASRGERLGPGLPMMLRSRAAP